MSLATYARGARALAESFNRYYRVLKGIDPDALTLTNGSATAPPLTVRSTGAAAHFRALHSVTGVPVVSITDSGLVGGGTLHDSGGAVFDVKAYGAVGDGVANDTAAIDAAVSACQTAGGGVVYFPPGTYSYSGAGILNNPLNTVNCPLLLRGAGPSASRLIFAAVANPDAIKLSSQTGVGGGVCWGSGVEGLGVFAPATTNAIAITNLEHWRVSNVVIGTCKTGLKIANTRFGRASHMYIYDWREHGISVNEGLTGVNDEDSWFEDIEISGIGSTVTGWGFSMMMGANPSGNNGTYLKHVVINYGLGGLRAGTTSVTPKDVLLFCVGLVADYGNFTQPAIQIKNGSTAFFEGACWAYASRSGGSIVELDNASYVSWIGGYATNGHGTAAGGGSVFDLKNGCTNLTIRPSLLLANAGTGVTGLASTAGTAPAALQFDAGLATGLAAITTPNKLLSAADQQRISTPTRFLTSAAKSAYSELAIFDEDMTNGKYLRINPTFNTLDFLNSTHGAVISSMGNAGDWTRRRRVSNGTALVAGDIVLSAGFGTTRSVTGVVGGDDHFRFIANAAGTTFSANPTITVTFKDGSFGSAPQCTVVKFGSFQPTTPIGWSTTATTLTINFAGTPVAGEAYEFSVMTTGR